MGLFDGVGKARFGGRDPNFNHGNEYLVEIEDITHFDSAVKNKGHFFKLRGKVLVSTDPKLRAGAVGCQLINLIHGEVALGDVKNLCEAAGRALFVKNGMDLKDFAINGEDDVEALCTPDQPCKGLIVGLRTVNKPTKNSPEFTQHFWMSAEDLMFSKPIDTSVLPQYPVAAANPGTVTPPAGTGKAGNAVG